MSDPTNPVVLSESDWRAIYTACSARVCVLDSFNALPERVRFLDIMKRIGIAGSRAYRAGAQSADNRLIRMGDDDAAMAAWNPPEADESIDAAASNPRPTCKVCKGDGFTLIRSDTPETDEPYEVLLCSACKRYTDLATAALVNFHRFQFVSGRVFCDSQYQLMRRSMNVESEVINRIKMILEGADCPPEIRLNDIQAALRILDDVDDVRRRRIVMLAREQRHLAGICEIDDDARVSENDGSDNGCYVQAWVWVEFDGTEFDKELNK